MKNNALSVYKIKKITEFFCEDFNASKTANTLKINRNTVNKYFNLFRERILLFSEREFFEGRGVFEADESYFGARRVRDKKGRGAGRKIPVFGLLQRDGKVFVRIVANCSKKELEPIIQGRVIEGSTINTDGWKAYDGLIRNYKHYRVRHSKDEFVRGKSHINGIESFWSYSKRRLSKFNGIAPDKFILHLKECEFRFNYRNQNLFEIMIKKVKILKSLV